jgi:hypothetical protein
VSKRWIYDAADPGFLADLDITLTPGQEFDAPDDWAPEPNPHPVYKPATPAKKPAPAIAPQE